MARKPGDYKRYTKENLRAWNLRRRFGIFVDEYDKMLQNGVCAVCGKTSLDGRRLAVDHNHITGEIRGLLCVSCNRALGLVYDNPNILRRLIKYLERRL